MTGLLNVLKIPGMTSHDVVGFLRRLTGIRRIGHGGTLDPEAAGVLPVCIGYATKMISYLDHTRKTYRVEMLLGVETDTHDNYGKIICKNETVPDENQIRMAALSFLGEYWQIPPMHSAVKVGGKKLYQLARNNQEIERKPRMKQVFSIDRLIIQPPLVMFDVVCSEGTYVRTLCHDIGKMLGCGAAITFLLRMESCKLPLHESHTLAEISNTEKSWHRCVIPVDHALTHYQRVQADETDEKRLRDGQCVSIPRHLDHLAMRAASNSKQLYRVYVSEKFVGLAHISSDGMLKLARQMIDK